MDDFATWLTEELQRRGWSRSEAGRRGGISAATIDRIIHGQANPNLDLYRRLALAFDLPLETVLRHAGVLPPRQGTPDEEAELLRLYHALSERDKRLALALAREMWREEQRRKKDEASARGAAPL